MDSRFLFLGGDRRSVFAAQAISKRRSVSALGLEGFSAPEGRYGAIVLPLPFMREGAINAPLCDVRLPLSLVSEYAAEGGTVFSGGSSAELVQLCESAGLRLVDYFADEPLTLKNAALTAEAAVAILVQSTEFSLCGAEVVITGGGRIAQLTARLLRSLGSRVTLCARDAVQRARAEAEYCETAALDVLPMLCVKAEVIVNTAPASLFREEHFRLMQAGAVFMELASKPSQPDEGYAQKYGVHYIFASGLPGKYSPKTAGEAIAEVILEKS